jgi:hypothetical protein
MGNENDLKWGTYSYFGRDCIVSGICTIDSPGFIKYNGMGAAQSWDFEYIKNFDDFLGAVRNYLQNPNGSIRDARDSLIWSFRERKDDIEKVFDEVRAKKSQE